MFLFLKISLPLLFWMVFMLSLLIFHWPHDSTTVWTRLMITVFHISLSYLELHIYRIQIEMQHSRIKQGGREKERGRERGGGGGGGRREWETEGERKI